MTELEAMAGDPILALLPGERPWAFNRLDVEAQKWRPDPLAVWIQSGSPPFAWTNALDVTLDEEVKAWVVSNLTDEVIRDGFSSRQKSEDEAAT